MTMRIADTATTEPASEPVTVAECKLDSRIDGTEFDTLLPALILAARQMAEHETGRRLITQVWRADGPNWPTSDDTIALVKFQSAVVTYWDGDSWETLNSTQYVVDNRGGSIAILPAYGVTWPDLGDLVGPRVRVDVTCGYGSSASDVPGALKMWIRQHVAAMLRNPDGLADATKMAPIHFLGSLLDPYRVYA